MRRPVVLMSFVLILSALVAAGCKDSTGSSGAVFDSIVYHDGGHVWVSALGMSTTPARAQAERHLHTIGSDWEVTAMAVSPAGRYAALGLWSPSPVSSREHEGRIIVFDILTASTVHDYRKAAMNDLGSFPIEDGAMYVFTLSWLSGNELLVNMQPQASWIESLPSNVSLVIDAPTGVRSSIEYYSRSGPAPVTAPQHSAHTKFAHELVGGVVEIRGQPVRDLRVGLQRYGVFFNP
jgi:hypothetical protein